MNSNSLSPNTLRQIFDTAVNLSVHDIVGLSRECSQLALQNIAESDFDLAHFYFNLAKEFMLIAVHRKVELTQAERVR